jgi:hypothetical protein
MFMERHTTRMATLNFLKITLKLMHLLVNYAPPMLKRVGIPSRFKFLVGMVVIMNSLPIRFTRLLISSDRIRANIPP